MTRFMPVFICWALLIANGSAQVATLSIGLVSLKFQDFAYREVIDLSDKLLASDAISDTTDLLELRRMRAIAYYTQDDAQAALTECLAILKLNPDYLFDPVKNSPKIIHFFEEVKRNVPLPEQPVVLRQDTDTLAIAGMAHQLSNQVFRASVLRSLVLPGWGSIYQGKKRRGYLLSSLAIATGAGAIYLWRLTDRRQSAYLNETDRQKIQSRYNDYNSSYKSRNAVISLLGAIWIYGQLDIAFFVPAKNLTAIGPVRTTLAPGEKSLTFRFQIDW